MNAVAEKNPYYKMKSLIEQSNFTQSEVAEKIEMDRSTFSLKINRKYGRDFSFAEAIEIAEVLETTISNFF